MSFCFTVEKDGPSADEYEFYKNIPFEDQLIQLLVNNENQYLISMEWENLGPFDTLENAYLGLCKYYFDQNKKYQSQWEKINDIIMRG